MVYVLSASLGFRTDLGNSQLLPFLVWLDACHQLPDLMRPVEPENRSAWEYLGREPDALQLHLSLWNNRSTYHADVIVQAHDSPVCALDQQL